ncbi:6-pyruvoyl trahydropterin synthase family protein [Blattabacterium cuenoti]|uniref:6-pyruvoyl trahydropterin synthase family protein n=1 Tax=Blattabacterium cuenoti TaxID=1653831 RepID=UPI00163BFA1A|nr:6-carboxytetrahydropterin synthase [Blattabacterium cuenoti]
MKIIISKKGYFSSAHRLYNKNWDHNKNLKIFGKCGNLNYHGHNYEYIVSLRGRINKETGLLFNLEKLKNILKKEIEEYFDHKNINLDLKEFRLINPTMENIVIFMWNKIIKKIPSNLELKITLYETKNNFVEYYGEY